MPRRHRPQRPSCREIRAGIPPTRTRGVGADRDRDDPPSGGPYPSTTPRHLTTAGSHPPPRPPTPAQRPADLWLRRVTGPIASDVNAGRKRQHPKLEQAGRKRQHLSIPGSARSRFKASGPEPDEQNGRRVHTDMDEWTEIRRKVLVEGASKRSIRRDYGIGHQALAKILANAEPPGYQMAEVRPEARSSGHFLATIDADPGRRQRGPAQATPHGPADLRAPARRVRLHRLLLPGADGGAARPRRYSKEAFVPLSHPPGHAQFDFGEATVEIAGERTKAAPGGHHAALFGHLLPLRLSARVHRDLPGRPRGGLRVLRRRAGADLL